MLLATALAGHGWRKARPSDTGPNSLIAKNIAESIYRHDHLQLGAVLAAETRREGDDCSQVCCPPPFLAVQLLPGHQRRKMKDLPQRPRGLL